MKKATLFVVLIVTFALTAPALALQGETPNPPGIPEIGVIFGALVGWPAFLSHFLGSPTACVSR